MRVIKFIALLLAALVVAAIALVYVAPESALRWAMAAERQRAGLERKEIELPGGLKYVYLEGGKGEPLMLFHGFGANKDNFNRVAQSLTPHWRVIVPDLVGFGESAHPPEADYSPSAQAERLRALAHALGAARPHLGGSSMGGHIALAYAARYPQEVKSLWLISPAGVRSAPESEAGKILRETGRNPLMARSEAEFAQIFEIVMAEPPFVSGPMLDVLARERIRNAALEERIFQQLGGDSVEARVAGLATPALIVWGEQDRALNVAAAGILHKLMPQSKLIVMPGIGHLPMIERPQQSAEDYIGFRAVQYRPARGRVAAAGTNRSSRRKSGSTMCRPCGSRRSPG